MVRTERSAEDPGRVSEGIPGTFEVALAQQHRADAVQAACDVTMVWSELITEDVQGTPMHIERSVEVAEIAYDVAEVVQAEGDVMVIPADVLLMDAQSALV